MAVKKAAKFGKAPSSGAKAASKRAKPVRLTPRQRQALEVVRKAAVDGDYELLMTIDKRTLRGLLEKKVVRLPTIQRPAVKGSVSPEAIRKALLAVEEERRKVESASGV